MGVLLSWRCLGASARQASRATYPRLDAPTHASAHPHASISPQCAESLKAENGALIQQFDRLKLKHEEATSVFQVRTCMHSSSSSSRRWVRVDPRVRMCLPPTTIAPLATNATQSQLGDLRERVAGVLGQFAGGKIDAAQLLKVGRGGGKQAVSMCALAQAALLHRTTRAIPAHLCTPAHTAAVPWRDGGGGAHGVSRRAEHAARGSAQRA